MHHILKTRPKTHAPIWSVETLTCGEITTFKIKIFCRACERYFTQNLDEFWYECRMMKDPREFYYLLEEMEKVFTPWHEELKEEKPEVHLLKPHVNYRLDHRRERLTYSCGKTALNGSEIDAVHQGLEVNLDDAGEGFTLAFDKLTCEACVRLIVDPILKHFNVPIY